MKRKLFLMTTLASVLFGANILSYGKEYNFYQTTQTAKMSKTQTETAKKEEAEKRAAAKKEAEQKSKEAKMTAKSSKTKSKKHKKFLGIF